MRQLFAGLLLSRLDDLHYWNGSGCDQVPLLVSSYDMQDWGGVVKT